MESDRRDALARTLAARLLLCNHDELRVLDRLLERLEIGRDRYGLLELGKPRDWEREEAEELLDAQIYRAINAIERSDARRERLRCEAADEIASNPIERGLVELRDAKPHDWPGPSDLGDEG